jgi:heme/copper-type cytochrome/quinol oxidase subunit 3
MEAPELASGAASAPTHPEIELEPPEWQPRAIWVGARQLCGAASFFFLAFLFAYFYLRSLDLNHDWKIGHNINPSMGLGVLIVVVLVLSAALLRLASSRPELTVRIENKRNLRA